MTLAVGGQFINFLVVLAVVVDCMPTHAAPHASPGHLGADVHTSVEGAPPAAAAEYLGLQALLGKFAFVICLRVSVQLLEGREDAHLPHTLHEREARPNTRLRRRIM